MNNFIRSMLLMKKLNPGKQRCLKLHSQDSAQSGEWSPCQTDFAICPCFCTPLSGRAEASRGGCSSRTLENTVGEAWCLSLLSQC